MKNSFDQLRELFDEYDFDNYPEAIYNMDETGVPLEPRPLKDIGLNPRTLQQQKYTQRQSLQDRKNHSEQTQKTKRHHNQKGDTIERYTEDGLKHLNNPIVYQPINKNIYPEITEANNKLLTDTLDKGLIDTETFNKIKPPKNPTSIIYFLKNCIRAPSV